MDRTFWRPHCGTALACVQEPVPSKLIRPWLGAPLVTLAHSPKGGPVPCGGEGTLPSPRLLRMSRSAAEQSTVARKCAGSEWGKAMKHHGAATTRIGAPRCLQSYSEQGEEEEGARARKLGLWMRRSEGALQKGA